MDEQERSILYRAISHLLIYPRELPAEEVEGFKSALKSLSEGNGGVTADMVLSFIEDLKAITPEQYVDVFEISPKCPLYLSYYAHEDDTARRRFMLEMVQDYKALGFGLNGGELPDFLPAVIEFLGLSLGREGRARMDFMAKYLTPWLPEISRRLESLGSPYHKLVKALDLMVNEELKMVVGG